METNELHDKICTTITKKDFAESKYWFNEKKILTRKNAIELIKQGKKIICDARYTTYSIEIGIVVKTVL